MSDEPIRDGWVQGEDPDGYTIWTLFIAVPPGYATVRSDPRGDGYTFGGCTYLWLVYAMVAAEASLKHRAEMSDPETRPEWLVAGTALRDARHGTSFRLIHAAGVAGCSVVEYSAAERGRRQPFSSEITSRLMAAFAADGAVHE